MSEQTTIARFIPMHRISVAPNIRTTSGLDDESLTALAESIKEHGLLQPIIVAEHEEGFSVIAGQRRTIAAKMAGMEEIHAIVIDRDASVEQMKVTQFIENLQREDLSLMETANAVREMLALYGKPALVSQHLKKSKAWVSKHLALTGPTFSRDVRELLKAGECQDLETLLALNQIEKQGAEGKVATAALIESIKTQQIGRAKVLDVLKGLKTAKADDLQDDEDEGEEGEGEGDDEPTGRATISFELSAAQAKQFEDLGGAQWLRRHLKKLAKVAA